MDLKTYLSGLPRGGSTALAKKLGISVSYLSQLSAKKSPLSPQRCVAIEKATCGAVTRQSLRKDWVEIWPELNNAPQE